MVGRGLHWALEKTEQEVKRGRQDGMEKERDAGRR